MQVLFLSISEKFAITLGEGEMRVWKPVEYSGTQGEKKVFEKNGKKVLMVHDRFSLDPRWNSSLKDAQYCTYGEFWFGEFPYGSWGVGFRQCKVTREVKLTRFETEINPRGLTGQDLFRRDCQTYVPASVNADLVAA